MILRNIDDVNECEPPHVRASGGDAGLLHELIVLDTLPLDAPRKPTGRAHTVRPSTKGQSRALDRPTGRRGRTLPQQRDSNAGRGT